MTRMIRAALPAAALLLTVSTTFAQKVSDPREQARAVYQMIHKQDWKAMFHMAAFSPVVAKTMPSDPARFAADVEKGIKDSGNKETVDKVFGGMTDMAVGKAVVKGSKADVPTSCKIKLDAKTIAFKGVAHMIKQNGMWKWDLTSADDPQKATSQALQDLLGKPVTATDPTKAKSAQ